MNQLPWKYIIIGVVVVLLVGGIIWYIANGNNPYYQPTSQTTSQTTSQNQPPISTHTVLSYTDAVKLYKDRRLQFDSKCLVVPFYTVFKRGTTIMLDNRYSKPRMVYLDGVAYALNGYGFTFVTLNTTAQLPHTIKIDCGTGKNNARILLEQ